MKQILVKLCEKDALRNSDGVLDFKCAELKSFEALINSIDRGKCVRTFNGNAVKMRRLLAKANATRDKPIPSLDLFVRVRVPDSASLVNLISRFQKQNAVEYAFEVTLTDDRAIEDVQTTRREEASETPDLTDLQGYIGSEGVNAEYAWTLCGGDGAGVRVCDCEHGFTVDHEDLPAIIVASNRDNTLKLGEFHGTRTLGVLFAKQNGKGTIGICHRSTPLFASSSGGHEACCLVDAINHLKRGDVLVVELESKGMPAERRPDIHAACSYATACGIVVVAAAGNGNSNLDKENDACQRLIWDQDSPDFDDSGAIIVGAGKPSTDPRFPLARAASSYGARVNCQGWGEMVATTGDDGVRDNIVFDGGSSDKTYSNYFGTSSATAMIAGVVACLQGIAKARDQNPLAPGVVRSLLSDPLNGKPQRDRGENARARDTPIGPLPDLKKLIQAIGGASSRSKSP